MKSFRAPKFHSMIRWTTVTLAILCLVGCQAMMKGKSRTKDPFAQDKFSCGESLPGARR